MPCDTRCATAGATAGATAVAIALVCASATSSAGQSFKRMADEKQWTTENLKIDIEGSYCYDNVARNCEQYGRLYTWEAAQKACRAVGEGWRLPTNEEWQRMAKGYGGIRDDSSDSGRAAYTALLIGGSSGFNAVLGGGRATDGEYARVDAHGFYWTASETDAGHAWLYNFGKGSVMLNRHRDGEKPRAFAARCIKDER
jgi:uncharacterized protein (TIGR02145 family)